MLMESSEYPKKGHGSVDDDEFLEEAESCRISFPVQESESGLNSLSDLDRLDRLSLAVLLVLLLAAVGLMVFHPGDTVLPARRLASNHQAAVLASPEFSKKMARAASILNGGDPALAGKLIDLMIADYPYEGGPHMLKGDLLLRGQQPIGAMLEYRLGVDLNPDYLDKKMPDVFQGKKVKNTLEEARKAIDDGLRRKPADPALRQQREVLYYMLRKVAGSCG